MKNEKTNKSQAISSNKSGDQKDLDPVRLNFEPDIENNPSEELERLFIDISLDKMEFISNNAKPKTYRTDRAINISSVSINGQVSYVQSFLLELLPSFTKFLDVYTNGDERHVTKVYELSTCKYKLQQFAYNSRVVLNGIGYSDNNYTVHFNNGKYDTLAYSQLILSSKALAQIKQHLAVRLEFIELIDQYIELLFDKLKYLEAKKEINSPNPLTKKGKELQLLEVWLALKVNGFLDHLKADDIKLKEADLRDRFFGIFNLACKKYNDDHKEMKRKNGSHGTFLLELSKTMENYPNKIKTKPPIK
jgi:hypothetical protein